MVAAIEAIRLNGYLNDAPTARALLSLKAPGVPKEPSGPELDTPSATQTWQERLRALTGVDLTICPNCG
jgi:hypothetical protein